MKLKIRLATILALTFLLVLTFFVTRLQAQNGPDLLTGMQLHVSLHQPIQARNLQAGDRLQAVLAAPLVRHDQVIVPAGTEAVLEVQSVAGAPLGNPKTLNLVLSEISHLGQTIYLESDAWQAQARDTHTLEKIGSGAAIGGMLGGWHGARKGALIGLGIALLTQGGTADIQPDEVLSFTLLGPVYLTAMRI